MSNFSAYTRIPTYSKLVDVIKVYLNRTDQDTVDAIPFFINAAEKTILRNLRMPSMEKMVKFGLGDLDSNVDSFVKIPFDYLEMKYVWSDNTTLHRVSFDKLIELRYKERLGDYVTPSWAINADRMYIVGIQKDDNLFMTYYADIEELSEDTDNNVLLELVPDAFLYLAVAEGFRFLMEESKSSYWESQGINRLNAVQMQVNNAEYSGSGLAIPEEY